MEVPEESLEREVSLLHAECERTELLIVALRDVYCEPKNYGTELAWLQAVDKQMHVLCQHIDVPFESVMPLLEVETS